MRTRPIPLAVVATVAAAIGSGGTFAFAAGADDVTHASVSTPPARTGPPAKSRGYEVWRSNVVQPNVDITTSGSIRQGTHVLTLHLDPGSYFVWSFVTAGKDTGTGVLRCAVLVPEGAVTFARVSMGDQPGTARGATLTSHGAFAVPDGGGGARAQMHAGTRSDGSDATSVRRRDRRSADRELHLDPGLVTVGWLGPCHRLRARRIRAVATLLVLSTLALAGAVLAAVVPGGPGNDTLRGTARADTLYGKGGNDRLFGLGGNDRLVGGIGNDILTGGGGADRLSCGPGRDIANADARDVVAYDCETVRGVPKPPASPEPAPWTGSRKVDVGGYALFIRCSGARRPTVVVDNGRGQTADRWEQVQPLVAANAHVCVYDRAGLGESDPRPSSVYPDNVRMIEELRTLLRNAGLAPPYVLVAWSFGGIERALLRVPLPDRGRRSCAARRGLGAGRLPRTRPSARARRLHRGRPAACERGLHLRRQAAGRAGARARH